MNGVDVGSYTAPSLVDQDNDGDFDMWVGTEYGNLQYYENTGSTTNPVFTARTGVNNPMNGVDVGNSAAPNLVDQDNDGDFDMWIGNDDGNLLYYEFGQICRQLTPCNGRGSCPFDSLNPTCACELGFVGASCQNCPSGTIEQPYVGGLRSLVVPPVCLSCPIGSWSNTPLVVLLAHPLGSSSSSSKILLRMTLGTK